MKCYLIFRDAKGKVTLLCQAIVKGKLVETWPAGPFSVGDTSPETQALALAITSHYYDASVNDPVALAEAQRRAPKFMNAFLVSENVRPGGRLEIPSSVMDRFFSM